MAKQSFTQTACLLYLIVSGHILVSSRRITTASQLQATAKQHSVSNSTSNSTSKVKGHPWCNPFSSLGRRSYHFDIEYTENKCEDGACMAIEFVRDKLNPLMKIHESQGWLVNRDTSGDLDWSLYTPGPETSEPVEKTVDLTGVYAIKFFDADSENPDKLEIISTVAPRNDTRYKAGFANAGFQNFEVLLIEGGLYYNEKVLLQGFEKLTAEKMKKIESNASKPTWACTGRNKGKWVGGVGGALSVGGMYTAATVTGVAVQTQALVGAALVGIIGGTVAGFVVGGIIGGIISVALVVAGYKSANGVPIKAAARKIFEKLRCIGEFKECRKNVLVPKEQSCHGI